MKCFEKTINYSSPGHGGWGIVRVGALVPEGHLLFVCPSACFRHGALGAIQHGNKHKASYLYITPAEVIAGYDDVIMEGVAELLKRTHDSIKVLFIFVACIDDFIGTDVEAICKELGNIYPEVTFRASHMNPIAVDTSKPPIVTTYHAMLSALKETENKRNTVNLLGNFVEIPKECEVFDVLRQYGFEDVRQLAAAKTYAAFQQMAESKMNLILSPIANYAAENLDKKINTKSIKAYISYDLAEIRNFYEALYTFCEGNEKYDFSAVEKETIEDICATVKQLKNREIIVSEGAVLRPFGLAYALLKYGFHVTEIVAQEAIPVDRESFLQIQKEYPGIVIKQPQHYRAVHRKTGYSDQLAIGFEGAYLENSEHVVNMNGDEGMFGYMGIRKLMQMLRRANAKKVNLREMIEEYGAVV